MELFQTFVKIYDAIPIGFWHHWLCVLGSIIAVTLEQPKGLLGWLNQFVIGWVIGYYGYAIVSKPIMAYLEGSEKETIENISRIIASFGGNSVAIWGRKWLIKNRDKDENPITSSK